MPGYRFTMGAVFPANDPVARWLVTLSIGLGDLICANMRLDETEDDRERTQMFRLSCLNLWETATVLKVRPKNVKQLGEPDQGCLGLLIARLAA